MEKFIHDVGVDMSLAEPGHVLIKERKYSFRPCFCEVQELSANIRIDTEESLSNLIKDDFQLLDYAYAFNRLQRYGLVIVEKIVDKKNGTVLKTIDVKDATGRIMELKGRGLTYGLYHIPRRVKLELINQDRLIITFQGISLRQTKLNEKLYYTAESWFEIPKMIVRDHTFSSLIFRVDGAIYSGDPEDDHKLMVIRDTYFEGLKSYVQSDHIPVIRYDEYKSDIWGESVSYLTKPYPGEFDYVNFQEKSVLKSVMKTLTAEASSVAAINSEFPIFKISRIEV